MITGGLIARIVKPSGDSQMFGSKKSMILGAAVLSLGMALTGCNRKETPSSGAQTMPSSNTTGSGTDAPLPGGTTATPPTGGTSGSTGAARDKKPANNATSSTPQTGTEPGGTPTTTPPTQGNQTR